MQKLNLNKNKNMSENKCRYQFIKYDIGDVHALICLWIYYPCFDLTSYSFPHFIYLSIWVHISIFLLLCIFPLFISTNVIYLKDNLLCSFFFASLLKIRGLSLKIGSGCGSGVGPTSCYWKVAGSIPLVWMSKWPRARYWTPNCSWCAGLINASLRCVIWSTFWLWFINIRDLLHICLASTLVATVLGPALKHITQSNPQKI